MEVHPPRHPLPFRLRWTQLCKVAIGNEANEADEKMMSLNLQRFDDPSGR